MCILGAARERGVVEIADRLLQLRSDRLPALAEFCLTRSPEYKVGEFGSAKAGEADELFLLLGHRRSLVGLDRRSKPDRGDIVARAILPALRQHAVVREMKVRTSRSECRWRRIPG